MSTVTTEGGLTAGRELDRRVAEALGYSFWRGDWYTPYLGNFAGDECLKELPRFSSDMGAAMGALLAFEDWMMARGESGFCVVLQRVRHNPMKHSPDLCLAICGAVLAAKGETKP